MVPQNGQLRERQVYQAGVKDGAWELFHENGRLRSRGNYKDGKRCGPFEVFHNNGQLRSGGTIGKIHEMATMNRTLKMVNWTLKVPI